MSSKTSTTSEVTRPSHTPHGRHVRKDGGDAFFPDPGDGPAQARDGLAQELAEEFLIEATSGEQIAEEARNEEVPEELGGPFVISPAEDEDELEDRVDELEPTALGREGYARV